MDRGKKQDIPPDFSPGSHLVRKILLIEDLNTDAELIIRAVRKEIKQASFFHIKNLHGLTEKFNEFQPDFVLSDYQLPGHNGLEALKTCRSLNPFIPFIIVTGAIDEETAVNCIKEGASDYVLKDNLIRLPTAIINAYEKSISLTEKENTERSLHESERQLSLILSTSPVGIVNVNKEGEIIYANNQAEKIFNLKNNELTNRKFDDTGWEITDFDGKPLPAENLPFSLIKKTLKPVKDIHHAIKMADGSLTYLTVNANPYFAPDTTFNGMIASIQDITEKVNSEKEIILSEQRYRKLFENMIEGYALHKIITDKTGKPVDYIFIDINPAFEKITGLKRSMVLNKRVKEIMPEIEDYWIFEYGIVALSGKPTHFTNYSKPLNKYFEVTAYSPQKEYFIVTFNDVTERKLYENELKTYQEKLKALNTELTLFEEREKRRLAINLHDHFSQLLAISKMRLTELINSKDFSKEKGQLSEIREYIEKALNNSRKLTYELSPPVLYELGLIHAMRWYIENESDSHGFEYSFKCKFKAIKLPENAQIILFRVFCELVTNIIKHANASHVTINVAKNDGFLQLNVADNGKGFNVKKNLIQTSSFGLFSIKERIEYLNGQFEIDSSPESGTYVTIIIPINNGV